MIDLEYLTKMAGNEQADTPAFMELIEAYSNLLKPRPIAEYHEDMGPVLWWKFPIDESPYVGGPNDLGHTVESEMILRRHGKREIKKQIRAQVGGWPGYHTHFTALPIARAP